MSVKILSQVWEHAAVEGRTLLVLLAIADWANDNGVAYPGMEAIAKKARCGVRTAQRAIEELQAAGLLSVQRNAGRYGTNLYIVTPSGGVPKLHPAKTAPRQNEQEVVQESTKGVPNRAPGGAKTNSFWHPNRQDPSVIEPSIDPSEDPSALRADFVWDSVLQELKPLITKANYSTWLEGSVGLEINGETSVLQVLVHSGFAQEWLNKRLKPLVVKTVSKIAAQPLKVEFVTKDLEAFG